MKTELVKKAHDILEEITELKKYEYFYKKTYKDTVHFEIREHYGSDSKSIHIERTHNERFLSLVKQIISELETELENL
jgi:hypothetical protein